MKRILSVIFILVLSGCVSSVPDRPKPDIELIKLSSSQFASVKKAVSAGMKDPDSARFGNYVAFRATEQNGTVFDVVCGYVNGKNSYGGYVGMTPYISTGKNKTFVTANGPSEYMMKVCQSMYGVAI